MPAHKLPDKKFPWTPSLAYVVGLLVTDGCLSSDGRHIIMRSQDVDLLETFKECLAINNKICIDKKPNGYISHRVQFGSVQFYRWLISIGLFPAKTYTIGRIKVPSKFFSDFLRGHLDGDGSILSYFDDYNKYYGRTYSNFRLAIKFISASKNHIRWLRNTIIKLYDLHGALFSSRPKTTNHVSIGILKFSKKESVALLKHMYYKPNLPCLKRKWLNAQNALKIIKNERRKIYTKVGSVLAVSPSTRQ